MICSTHNVFVIIYNTNLLAWAEYSIDPNPKQANIQTTPGNRNESGYILDLGLGVAKTADEI